MKRTMQKLPIKWCISYFFPFWFCLRFFFHKHSTTWKNYINFVWKISIESKTEGFAWINSNRLFSSFTLPAWFHSLRFSPCFIMNWSLWSAANNWMPTATESTNVLVIVYDKCLYAFARSVDDLCRMPNECCVYESIQCSFLSHLDLRTKFEYIHLKLKSFWKRTASLSTCLMKKTLDSIQFVNIFLLLFFISVFL